MKTYSKKWMRARFTPCLPLGADGRLVTGSEKHIQLSRQAATEGMVLLKNEENILPFAGGTRLALFGKGSVDYVKGGGGSGDVTVSYVRNLQEGLRIKEQEHKVQVFDKLADFYQKNVDQQYENGCEPGKTQEPEVPEEIVALAKAWTDTAVISICRFSEESYDRKGIPGDGDFYLTKEEQDLVDTVTANFAHVVVVLNVGGMVDTSWFRENEKIQGVLLAWQAGMEGGLATADILCGDVNPSGKLTDTFAGCFDDYPSSANFNESEDYVEYKEDIYVGYRYFETIPGAAKKVNYPFGYGLSYTTFDKKVVQVQEKEEAICVTVLVTNMGNYEGKEVVQLYYGAPQGVLGKPAKELGAFAKTRTLGCGDSQMLCLTLPIKDMASYDDLGKIAKSAYVLEKGSYHFWLGGSVREAEKIEYTYEVAENQVVEQLQSKCAPTQLKERLLSDGTYELLPMDGQAVIENVLGDLPKPDVWAWEPHVRGVESLKVSRVKGEWRLLDVAEGRVDLDTFLAQLTDREVAELLGGQPNTGVGDTYGMGNFPEHGIPNIMTADGPAGFRTHIESQVCATAWPCATLLACTWNEKLVEQVGAAAALEVKENNMGVWLAPAMNIHRSPLCGRNFEYYSEDPLVTGKIGAAMIRGIQSQHIACSMKHFCCNNKETNRTYSDSRLSERALREIYLKGFEIAVKEADPWTVMTCYNKVNGNRPSCNPELLEDILRGEWGFQGMVVTDWWNLGEHYLEVLAGNDLKMGRGFPDRLMEAMEKGLLNRSQMDVCAKRILNLILKID